MRNLALALALLAPTAAPAAASYLDGVAVFGGSSATVNSNVTGGAVAGNGDVTLGAFVAVPTVTAGGSLGGGGTVNGPVTVNGDVTGGGLGTAVNGPVNAGGNFGRSGTTTGNVTAAGDVTLQSSATVNGDVLAGGNVSLVPISRVNGSVTANGSITITGGPVTGAVTPFAGVPVTPVPYVPVTLAADAFTAGGADVGGGSLAPGSYGALTVPVFGSLTLSAGDYFFDRFTLTGASTLNFDLTGGPINVFVTGDIVLGGFLTVTANGVNVRVGDTPNPAVRDLAAQVLFETLGSATSDGVVFGTLYAPNGNIRTAFDPVFGSLVAGGTVTVEAFSPVFYVGNDRLLGTGTAAVPEPAPVALLAAGGAAAVCLRRRWAAA